MAGLLGRVATFGEVDHGEVHGLRLRGFTPNEELADLRMRAITAHGDATGFGGAIAEGDAYAVTADADTLEIFAKLVITPHISPLVF